MTKMPELEKVIKNLQTAANICALNGDIQSMRTISDALALLKAQVPRVMTLEEARETLHTADFLVIEDRENVDLVLGVRTLTAWDLSTGAYLDFDDLDDNAKSGDYYVRHYNKDFRFWTARPTEEQREAVKFDDPENT